MELRHYRDFVAVAEELNFSRAAARLHVAQPSLSRQVKNLEEEIGALLFDRVKGRVALTEAGRAFLSDAKEMLQLAAKSVESVHALSRREAAMLNIGYLASFHYRLLPATLGAFSKLHPGANLRLFAMTFADQLRALEENRLDLGFVATQERLADGLRGERVAAYPGVLAVSAASPLARTRTIALEDLGSSPFIGLSEESHPDYQEWIRHLSQEAPLTLRILHEAGHESAVLGLVAAGLGVALLPEQIRSLPHEGIIFRRLTPALTFECCVAWREDNPSRLLPELVQIIKHASSASGG